MYAVVLGAILHGLFPKPVQVEADLSDGLPGIYLVGDLAPEVRASSARVRTALHNAGIQLPARKIVINPAPADLRKTGAALDLPIAISIAAVNRQIPVGDLSHILFLGEVGLNGDISSVPGVFPIVQKLKENGITHCVVPMDNFREASLVSDVTVVGVESLSQVLAFLRTGERPPVPTEIGQSQIVSAASVRVGDFSDIRGQEGVKRAALISAAGFHNMLIMGSPGSGKSMTASRIPGIMPPLTEAEQLELTSIYSAAGLLSSEQPLMEVRPYRAPHHTITGPGLIGAGAFPKPGEITLAHSGVLFLDELTEYRRPVLELLRQPLEEHRIRLTRSAGRFEYPSDFLLVGAMNPCPCGYFPDLGKCHCTEQEIRRYQSRISGPLLDRIDLCVSATRIPYEELAKNTGSKKTWSTETMREKVIAAREIQKNRFRDHAYSFNGRIPSSEVHRWCVLTKEAEHMMQAAYTSLQLTVRSYHRTLRVARTIADLEGAFNIEETHLSEALGYRCSEEIT